MGDITNEFRNLFDNNSNNKKDDEYWINFSNNNIQKFRVFEEKYKQEPTMTYSGVPIGSILECISIKSTEHIRYEHTVMQIDVSKIKRLDGSSIKEIKLPDFIEEIQPVQDKHDGFGFNGSTHNYIEIIGIPDSIRIINDAAFLMYKKLVKIFIDEGSNIQYIGKMAFRDTKLKQLNLSNCKQLTTQNIHNEAFRGCKLLSKLKLPNSITDEDIINNKNKFKDTKCKFIYIDKSKVAIK